MVPHGDRKDRSDSTGVEDEIAVIFDHEEYVMGVLVLNHDVERDDRWISTDGPAERLIQAVEASNLGQQRSGVIEHRLESTSDRIGVGLYSCPMNRMPIAGLGCLYVALMVTPPATASDPTALRIVVTADSPALPADSPDRLPRTIWRSGKNRARIEGVISAETGHRILVVMASPHLWFADLDSATGYHTLDSGPEIGASVPVFPVPDKELESLEFGGEAAYFAHHAAKSLGLTSMNGKSCERKDIETSDYLLVGCFEPMTERPVALGLRMGELILGINYVQYERDAVPPPGAFARPSNVRFTERPHQDKTLAAQ
jgi:hypothetical protein